MFNVEGVTITVCNCFDILFRECGQVNNSNLILLLRNLMLMFKKWYFQFREFHFQHCHQVLRDESVFFIGSHSRSELCQICVNGTEAVFKFPETTETAKDICEIYFNFDSYI